MNGSDTTVPVCPSCDSTRINSRSGRSDVRHTRFGDQDADWQCEECKHTFDVPERREPTTESPALKTGSQARLLAMDPAEVP